MTQAEFISRIAARLNETGCRKLVSMKKQVYHLRDDDGHGADFSYKPDDKAVLYNRKDVEAFMKAFVDVIGDCMQHGESVRVTDLGVFNVAHYRARRSKQPGTDIWYECSARYVPKLNFANAMRRRAILYDGPEEEPVEEDQDGDVINGDS